MAGDDLASENLQSPPINEVVCGFIFEPLPELDPVLIGAYWSTRRSDFPGKQIAPPVADPPMSFLGEMPMFRTLLISEGKEFLLQIQPERFYLNWRRRDDEYPRFSDHPGRSVGILSKALVEFGRFQDFCGSHLGKKPTPARLELAKVDCLVEGSHWRDLEDLSRMLPWVRPLTSFAQNPELQLAVRFGEDRATGRLAVSIASGRRQRENRIERIVSLESRLSAAVTTNPKDDFARLNAELNGVFASLIPKEERHARFGKPR